MTQITEVPSTLNFNISTPNPVIITHSTTRIIFHYNFIVTFIKKFKKRLKKCSCLSLPYIFGWFAPMIVTVKLENAISRFIPSWLHQTKRQHFKLLSRYIKKTRVTMVGWVGELIDPALPQHHLLNILVVWYVIHSDGNFCCYPMAIYSNFLECTRIWIWILYIYITI